MAVKRWVIIAGGIVVFIVIIGVGLVATVAYLAYRQVDVSTSQTMPDDFDTLRARFAGQTPYLEFRDEDRGQPVVHRDQERTKRVPLNTLHVVAWMPRDHRVVRFNMPFWLVRLSRHGTIRLSSDHGSGFSFDAGESITAEDIERHGPGLILDTQQRNGERVLVWVD